ncbi:hypothetical protein [Exiguobacterium acetylicum]|uniref:hypothetical protein n=1 Tax=Exiguobacterium acetylicum TaxID=41170 RepID=UPI001CA66316|nr:hypothetical protein [Exiguobacterium acetylicum]QZY88586.1 hypothetical protein K7G97_16770 [Exiguobacterium acetylicum]
MPDHIGWLSEYEFEYLRLYKLYNDEGLTDQHLKELSEIARLLYPPVSKRLGHGNDHVMIKAAYNIAIKGGKKAGFLIYTMNSRDVEYMNWNALRYMEGTPKHHRERKYREFKFVSLDGLLDNGYHFNEGLKCKRLGGRNRYEYVVYG